MYAFVNIKTKPINNASCKTMWTRAKFILIVISTISFLDFQYLCYLDAIKSSNYKNDINKKARIPTDNKFAVEEHFNSKAISKRQHSNIKKPKQAKFIVLASNHGMGSSTSIKAIGCCNSCIINLREPFMAFNRLAHPKGASNAIFFTDGTFIGGNPQTMIKQLMIYFNGTIINFNGTLIDGNLIHGNPNDIKLMKKSNVAKMLSKDFFPKHATGVLDWFIQVHDKLSQIHVEFPKPECTVTHRTIAMKMLPIYINNNYEILREFLLSEDTVVVHQIRNYTDARASFARRIGCGKCDGSDVLQDERCSCDDEDKKWDAWLNSLGKDMIQVKAEDLWAQPDFKGYSILRNDVHEKAGIPTDDKIAIEDLNIEKLYQHQHSKTYVPKKSSRN